MVHFSRRRWLQAAGASLASWGLHQAFDRHHAVLAQSTPRKLALLVGINDYADAPLFGCVNDVILQKFLLVDRFGFNPKDILVLTDGQATRQGMLDAFEEHLIKQARPGDVVVYHYSGHGSWVRDPDPIFVDRRDRGFNGTFVPADSALNKATDGTETVSDIMGHTLFLLMSAIQTNHFTAVLDSCYSGAAARPELVVRSREVPETVTIAPQEKAYQDRWLSRLGWSHDEFVERYQRGIANGVVLSSTQPDQLAVDESFGDFAAGAFTSRLTQHLWQQESTPVEAIAHINRIIDRRYNQNPMWQAELGQGHENDPLFFTPPTAPAADAIVLDVNAAGTVRLVIVGRDPREIPNGSILKTSDQRSRVRITGRNKLTATGLVLGRPLERGDLLQLQ